MNTKKKIFHLPITVKAICKNGSERYGAVATCKYWHEEPERLKIEVSQYGKNMNAAKEKLINFLEGNGKYQRIEKEEIEVINA